MRGPVRSTKIAETATESRASHSPFPRRHVDLGKRRLFLSSMYSPQGRPDATAGDYGPRAKALQAKMDAIYAGNVQPVPLQGMDPIPQFRRCLLLEYRTFGKIVL